MSRWPRYVIARSEPLVHLGGEGTNVFCGRNVVQGQVITKRRLVPTCLYCLAHWDFLKRRWPEAGW